MPGVNKVAKLGPRKNVDATRTDWAPRFLELFGQSKDVKEAARLTGVCRRTIYNRIDRDAAFRAAVDTIRNAGVRRFCGLLGGRHNGGAEAQAEACAALAQLLEITGRLHSALTGPSARAFAESFPSQFLAIQASDAVDGLGAYIELLEGPE
jgi:hypothetical protein